MRKTLILMFACMCLAFSANAQRNSGRLSLGVGLLYRNGMDVTFSYEHEMNYRHAWEFFANGYLQWAECGPCGHICPESFWRNYRTYGFGVAYKPCVVRGRNHYGNLRIGASAGSDTKKFLGGLHFGYEHNYVLRSGWTLRESHETLGGIVFVLSIALMVLSFISGRGDEKRLPAYWAKYQQIHRMDNLLRANLVGVWLCAEARVAVYREGSGYRVQLGVLDEKTGAWENDEQDEVFPTLIDVREYASQEGYEPMDVDFEQMTDEEFQQFLDRSRI